MARRTQRFDLRRSFALRVAALLCCSGTPSCDAPSPANNEVGSAIPESSSTPAADSHSEHDCSSAHSSVDTRPPPPRATQLSGEARERLTTLQVSAHVGSVFIRRRDDSWFVGGSNKCIVPEGRIEAALDDLAQLDAVPTEERPQHGSNFELQVIALAGEQRMLHFDVAERDTRGDLVQLLDGSRFHVQGLDRGLWSPHPRDWCREWVPSEPPGTHAFQSPSTRSPALGGSGASRTPQSEADHPPRVVAHDR